MNKPNIKEIKKAQDSNLHKLIEETKDMEVNDSEIQVILNTRLEMMQNLITKLEE